MLKTRYLDKEGWNMYLFYPKENDKFKKLSKKVRKHIERNNRHFIWISKDSEWILETFVDDVGSKYFEQDLDIYWVKEYVSPQLGINDDSIMYFYDEDDGGWNKVDDKYKCLMY